MKLIVSCRLDSLGILSRMCANEKHKEQLNRTNFSQVILNVLNGL